jgi:hypothetical protein
MNANSLLARPALFLTAALLAAAVNTDEPAQRLTSQPRPALAAAPALAVGDAIETKAGQRRRLTLPGGAMLFVNENSRLKLEEAGLLRLSGGEVFVDGADLVVKSGRRQVQGRQASFAVRAGDKGAGVLVTRGQVQVAGLDNPLHAGQQLLADADKASAAPRASLLLDWTRELRAAALSPLVPASQFAGGALVAVDPNGQEARLTLRKFHIDVFIEDGFARTTIDQTYFNKDAWQMEGTFYFPLPADASLSQLAMYVEGDLMEGGMVERDYARQVYETIRYARRDPALLEWVDGSTFKMRVFPLEPRQEKRVLLSYTQKLPALYDQWQYRFPAGHSLQAVRDWSVQVRVKNGAGMGWHSPSHSLVATKDGSDLVLAATAKNARTDRDVVLWLASGAASARRAPVHFATETQDGARYLLVRLRPDLLAAARPAAPAQERQPRHWVFLFESSGDRDPLLGRVQIEVIRGLLSQAEADDTFTVLTAGTRVRAFAQEPLPVNPKNVEAALAFLEHSHLVGALDLGRALAAAAKASGGRQPPVEGRTGGSRPPLAYLVHVGSGVAAMGERREDVLARSIPEGVRYVGVGVGKRWARSFMKAAAERSGGYFTQINPDESVTWRAFDLAATLRTLPGGPGLSPEVSLAGGEGRFLYVSRSLAPGEEFCAVTRLPGKAELPREVLVSLGEGEAVPLPLREVAEGAAYLPRTWAKLEIERLLADDAAKNKGAIIALSKAMYVMTPYTSLLVLENEDMYTQYKVDRSRQDRWALYPAPKKIAVVYEPDPDQPDPKAKVGQKLPARQILNTILVRDSVEMVTTPTAAVFGKKYEDGGFYFAPEFLYMKRSAAPMAASPPGVGRVRTFADTTGVITSGASLARFEVLSVTQMSESVAGKRESIMIAGDQVTKDRVLRRIVAVDAGKILGYPQLRAKPLPSGGVAGLTFQFRGLDTSSPSDFDIRAAVDPDFLAKYRARMRVLGEEKTDFFLKVLDEPSAVQDSAIADRGTRRSLLYRRPTYSGQDRLFYDLVAYCPGLNTTEADIRAVLEAEALPDPDSKPGKIDAGARALIEKSRPAGWQALTVTGEDNRPGFTIVFDGGGRYAWQQTLPIGIREQVACDGKTLLHLYPQLNLAAHRAVSRFHREDFSSLVPWVLPRPEDLARGADLKQIDKRTVAVMPLGAADNANERRGLSPPAGPPGQARRLVKSRPYLRLHLVFAEDGRLAERQVVAMPKGEVLLRQVSEAGGTVRVLDKAGKELAVRHGKLSEPVAPDVSPDTRNLVVLDLPFRSREHLVKALKLEKTGYEQMRFAAALRLLAADVAAGNGAEAVKVFRQALHAREQRQLGLYVLLAACGQSLDAENLDVLAEHMDEPLAQYLALHSSPVLRKHASQWAAASAPWGGESYLQHLALTHALLQRWSDERVNKGSAARVLADRQRALDYVRRNNDAFAWALLGLLQDRAGDSPTLHGELAESWRLFEDQPEFRYAARYEFARSLFKAGQRAEARKRFRTLYEETLQDGILPPVDADFRQALQGGSATADLWTELLRKTAQGLVKEQRRPAVLALARQCWQLEDPALADQLIAIALDGAPEKERTPLSVAAVEFFRETAQLPQADDLLHKLLADAKLARRADLWRLAADVAAKRDMTGRSLECLEHALDAEYAKLPAVIDLETVRTEYGKLLEHYQNLADAMVTLKVQPPAGFLAKVVRTADRWRALDREQASACQTAARILRALGERELGWDYLTTPVGLKPNEAGPWVELAQGLRRTGDLSLADRAYRAAAEAEPTNADYLWERADNLRQAGRQPEALQLFRRIAEGRWQPRFQPTQARARALVGAS